MTDANDTSTASGVATPSHTLDTIRELARRWAGLTCESEHAHVRASCGTLVYRSHVWGVGYRYFACEASRLDDQERADLLGWVRETMTCEVERVRAAMRRFAARGDVNVDPDPEWMSRTIARSLLVDSKVALALCEAAGWPS